jgi:hypothetical protein
MNHVRSIRAVVWTALLLLIGPVVLMPLAVSASSSTPPTVPGEIAVPAGSVLLFSRRAQGVQIYACQAGQWTFHAPLALLFDPETKQPDGIHYGGIDRGLTPGPWWESLVDGSRIRGALVRPAPSPNRNSIPLLLLQVLERSGDGSFTPVTHIQRLNTVGGLAPTGTCSTDTHRPVPYSADYYFYAAPAQ